MKKKAVEQRLVQKCYPLFTGSVMVGDTVTLSDSEVYVKESFNSIRHGWKDIMRSMLGKTFPVCDVLEGGIIGLHSPHKSDSTQLYFHESAMRKSPGETLI